MTVTELALLTLLPESLVQSQPTTINSSTTSSGNNQEPPEIKPQLLSDLHHAQKVLTNASSHQFAFYRCIEHPLRIYIIGSWESPAYHRQVFLPSAENQDLLETLKDKLTVEFMIHIDLDQTIHPIFSQDNSAGVSDSNNNGNEGVLALGQHRLSHKNRSGFQKCFDENVIFLKDFMHQQPQPQKSTPNAENELSLSSSASSSSSRGSTVVEGGWKIHEPEHELTTSTSSSNDRNETSKNKEQEQEQEQEEFFLFTSWPKVESHIAFSKTEGFQKYARIREFIDRGFEVVHLKRIDFSFFDFVSE